MERFQRTRGVLRLMAAVIHELWMANDASAMIMPGSLPLDMPNVRDELVRHLPDTCGLGNPYIKLNQIVMQNSLQRHAIILVIYYPMMSIQYVRENPCFALRLSFEKT